MNTLSKRYVFTQALLLGEGKSKTKTAGINILIFMPTGEGAEAQFRSPSSYGVQAPSSSCSLQEAGPIR